MNIPVALLKAGVITVHTKDMSWTSTHPGLWIAQHNEPEYEFGKMIGEDIYELLYPSADPIRRRGIARVYAYLDLGLNSREQLLYILEKEGKKPFK